MKTHDLITTLTNITHEQAKFFIEGILCGEIKVDVLPGADGGALIQRFAETGRRLEANNGGVWGIMVNGLIDAGADPWIDAHKFSETKDDEIADGKNASIFLMACKQRHRDLILRLLKMPGAPTPTTLAPLHVGKEGYSKLSNLNPLNYLVQEDDTKMVTFLINQGFHPDTRDASGNTALACAGNPDMVRLLIENGANPWLGLRDGRTLHELWNERHASTLATEFTRAMSVTAGKQKREDSAWKKGRLAAMLRSPTSLRNVQAAMREAGETLESYIDEERPNIKVSHLWACSLANQTFGVDTVAGRENLDRMAAYLSQHQSDSPDPDLAEDLRFLRLAQNSGATKKMSEVEQAEAWNKALQHFERRLGDGLITKQIQLASHFIRTIVPGFAHSYPGTDGGAARFSKEDKWMLRDPIIWKLAQYLVRLDKKSLKKDDNNHITLIQILANIGKSFDWTTQTRKDAWTAILPFLNSEATPNVYQSSRYPEPNRGSAVISCFDWKKHVLHGLAIELVGGGEVWDMDRKDISGRLEAINKPTKGHYSEVQGDPVVFSALNRSYQNKMLEREVTQAPAVVRRRI
jgi:hypothetical protein